MRSFFFFSSRRRHTRLQGDWSSDVCSSDLPLLPDGGKIVLVSSTAGQRGEPFHADYAATKGAVISFTKSLAVELAPRRINVNCVAPGWVDTEMSATPYARDAGRGKEDIKRTIPLGRVASPEDCAGPDRKSTRLNSSHLVISYAVFCLKKKKNENIQAFLQ